ncbi:MAG: porin, partial [Limnohabitans sp.]
TLFALAVLAASGASFAQSTVTLYGQADAALTSAKSGANSVSGLFGAGRGSNYVGFMGTEDLGGGWNANFKLEAQYSLDTGAGSSSNTNNQATGGLTTQSGAATSPTLNAAPETRASLGGAQGLTFNRWSYAGLSNAAVGEIRVGREYTPSFQSILGADVVGANGAGNSLNMTLMLAGQSANLISVGTSASNGVSYQTPNIAGFQAKAMAIFGENPNTGSTTSLNAPKAGNGNSWNLTYAQGPLSAGVAGLTVKGTRVAPASAVAPTVTTVTTEAANVNTSTSTYTAGSPATAGLPGDYKQASAYAKYDFGVALATVGQVQEKLITPASASESVNKSTIVGVSVPFGAYKLNANYITSKYTLGGADTGKANQLAIQGMYAMSKRTDLYATYAIVDNSLGKSYGLGNGAGRMVTVSNNGDKSTAYQVGIRHNF